MEQDSARDGNLAASSSKKPMPSVDEITVKSEGDSNADTVAEKCSICLGFPMVDEASLDGCLHRFCFLCITEWIKLRPICPMCKRPVEKLFHQVKSADGEESTGEVTVGSIQRMAIQERIEAETIRPLILERTEMVRRVRHLQRLVRVHDDVFNDGRIGSALEDDNRRRQYVDRINRYQLLLDNWERPRREIVSDPAFRTLVYELRLHRSPLVRSAQAATRRTGISPQYFRDNEETERTRISEFVRRELIALIPNIPNLEAVVEHVYNLAMSHQIMSPQFTSHLCRQCLALADFVDHFVELLYEFAVSGQDLDLFDQNSEYVSRTEYRRRLRNMNMLLLGSNTDDDDILVELDNLEAQNRNRDAELAQGAAGGPSPSHLHFISAYTDALISLRRFLLILETSDEILSPNEETALGETIEAIVQSYVHYRNRIRNRQQNQTMALQNSNQGREIVLSDSDSDTGQGSSAGGGGNSQSASQNISNDNRRRFERLRRRRRNQHGISSRLRQRVLRSAADSLRYRYFSDFHLSRDQAREAVITVRGMLGENSYTTIDFPPPAATTAEGLSSSRNAVIDLDNSSTADDDDVMVVSELPPEGDGRDGNDDIVIEDDAAHQDVLLDDDNYPDSSIVLNEES